MIIQMLLDGFSAFLADFLRQIPPFPTYWDSSLAAVRSGGDWLVANLQPFGAVVPFNQIQLILAVWFGLVQFWIAMLGIRFLLWILGR